MQGRIVLVTELDEHWMRLVRWLEQERYEVDVLPPAAGPADVVACAARGRAVVIVDLTADPSSGLSVAASCRAAKVGPVIAVAANPTADLTRRVRLAGAFFLALRPVSPDELGSILSSAFASIDRQRTRASDCRATRRVLIVDDDADFTAATRAVLEACGYAVSTASTGREGLARIREAPPDLIVLDVMMEHESAGYELTQAVKYGEEIRHVPILMVSSIDLPPDVRFAAASEAPMVTPNAYLTKPLDIGRFLREVSELLGEPQAALAGASR